MKRFILLLILGVVAHTAAFPPLDLGPLVVVALAALGMAFLEPMGRARWLAVYAAGVALFIAGCAWLADIFVLFPLFMAVFEGLTLPLFCLLFRTTHLRCRFPVWLALPVAWVAVEYLRSIFPLDGFPWLLAGYSLWRITPLIQAADITGVYGMSFLLALSAGVLLAWFLCVKEKRVKKPLIGTGVLALGLAGALAYGFIRPATLEVEEGPVLAAVQGNIPQELKHGAGGAGQIFAHYRDVTNRIFEAPSPPSLVVWPETFFPFPLGEGQPGDRWLPGIGYSESLLCERKLIGVEIVERILAPHEAWFLTGVLGYRLGKEGALERRNAAYLYDPEGIRKGVYYKTLLVPGGEYLPYIDAVPFGDSLKNLIETQAGFLPDLEPGFGPQLMTFTASGEPYRFGVQICYENIYGDYCRRFIKEGADFLINISNEGWFHSASEFDQMLAISVFRAVEMRRSLFRGTNTGISCVIGPEGKVPPMEDRITENGVDKNVEGVLVKRVPLCHTASLYVQHGDRFAQAVFFVQIICLLFLLFKFLWGKKVASPCSGR